MTSSRPRKSFNDCHHLAGDAFVVDYGIMISPFLVVGVILLIVLEKRRVKLDAPVRFPRRSTLQPRADS